MDWQQSCGLSLLRDTFPPSKLAIAVGVFGSAYSAGSVVGLLAGATIIQNLGWHSTFFSIVTICSGRDNHDCQIRKRKQRRVGSSSQVSTRCRYQKRTSPSIDFRGALALSGTIISFLVGLTLVQTGTNPENLPQIAVRFVVSVISLTIFVFIERRIAFPLVDLRLLKDKILQPSYMILMATGITMFMTYPAIVALVRSPMPLGFGGNPVDAPNVQRLS